MQNNQKYKSAVTTKYTIYKRLLSLGDHYVSITVLSSFIHYSAYYQKISRSSYIDSLGFGTVCPSFGCSTWSFISVKPTDWFISHTANCIILPTLGVHKPNESISAF